jgi:hypothetical protein
MVPKEGVEPSWGAAPRDFESRASADSATSALCDCDSDMIAQRPVLGKFILGGGGRRARVSFTVSRKIKTDTGKGGSLWGII